MKYIFIDIKCSHGLPSSKSSQIFPYFPTFLSSSCYFSLFAKQNESAICVDERLLSVEPALDCG